MDVSLNLFVVITITCNMTIYCLCVYCVICLFLGKSSLTIQFVENHFVDNYEPTIENSELMELKCKAIIIDDRVNEFFQFCLMKLMHDCLRCYLSVSLLLGCDSKLYKIPY